jgi:hypothetical protein
MEELDALEAEGKEMARELTYDIEEEMPTEETIEQEREAIGQLSIYNWFDWVLYFRWIVNALFVGIPAFVFVNFSNLWNLYFNVWLNHDWAGFNTLLILNSLICGLQSWNGGWLAFEIEMYLKWFKLQRMFSLVVGLIWNFVFTCFLWNLFVQVVEYDYESMGTPSAFEMFKDLFMVYTIIQHFPIYIVNFFIIFKEI